jgi:DNA-binding MarR family transcriptional regulator
MPSITSADRDGAQPVGWLVRDRLTDGQIAALVARFQAGELQKHLAAEYGVSRSTVKRLLTRHDARRYQPRTRVKDRLALRLTTGAAPEAHGCSGVFRG